MLQSSGFKFIVTIACCLTTQIALAQTGPGGVGNSTTNELWLKADDLSGMADGTQISSWSDQSGNSHHATQATSSYQPTVQLNEINGLPVVQLDGSDDNLDDNHSYTARTMYGVFRISSTLQQSSMLGQFWGSYGEAVHIAMDARSGNLRGFSFDAAPINTNRGRIALDGGSYGSFAYNSNSPSWSYDQAHHMAVEFEADRSLTRQVIGTLVPNFSVGGHQYGGDVAEVIVYNVVHNDAERSIIQNYLAAKYNITISNDLYSYEGTHSSQLIGIGQASDGTNHTTASGDGILTISSPSALSNSEYFMVAHDGESVSLADTCDAPGLYGKRLVRSWKVGQTGDVGTVSMSFDLSGLSGLGSVSDLALIQSSAADFTGATVHTTGVSLVGSTLSFTGVDLNDGDIFTVAQLGSTVNWDGASWSNGSGGSGVPSAADASKKLVVSSTGGGLSADAACECAWVDASAELSLTSNASLTVANGIINNGSINVASGASLVQTGSTANSGSGSYMIQRSSGTLNDDTRFQYWSSPVQSTSMGAVFTGSNTVDFYYFDEGSTNNWASQASGATMTPARGYITTGTIGISNAAETRVFNGTVNNGSVSLATSSVSSGENILVGNPYPSAVNSTSFVTDNTTINGTLWFWNHFTAESGGNNTDSDYATWTSTGSTSGNGATTPDDYIQSCQSFFVETISANPTITFTNDQRVSGNNTQFFKQEQQTDKHRVWLALTNDSNDFNQILIGFLPQATDGADRLYDGKKYKAHPRLAFYSILDSVDYSIQGLNVPTYLEEKIIPLGVDAWITGIHTIFIDSLDNWPKDYSIHLIDGLNQTSQDLREEPTYTFQVDQTGEIRDRFAIAVLNNTVLDTIIQDTNITSTQEIGVEETKIQFTISNGSINVSSDDVIDQINVFNTAGQLMSTSSPRSINHEIPVSNWHTGVYIIRCTTSNGQVVTNKILL